MILHKNRSHRTLISQLESLLTVDGKNGLLKTATRLNDPFPKDGQLYDKAICIDFHGLAATALFGRGWVWPPTVFLNSLMPWRNVQPPSTNAVSSSKSEFYSSIHTPRPASSHSS